MKKLIIALILLALPSVAWAQRVDANSTRIAAVVNDNVITTTDVDERLSLALISSGLPDNPDTRAHLLPQILRELIDEKLQAQEAKRLDLSVTQEEIDQAFQRIAQNNNIEGGLEAYITAHGASPVALTDQVRTELLWNKVVARELRPHVEVGDDEVDAVINRIRANTGKQEYLVSEIFLAVDNPKDEEQVHQVADNLVDQIKKGANFAAVARQFSQGSSAAQGGDIGWIQQGQLTKELDDALVLANASQVSDPIRTANGFHILGIREKRLVSLGSVGKSTMSLTQAFRSYSEGADKDALMGEAGRLRNAVKSCSDIEGVLPSFPEWRIQKMGDMNPAKSPPWLVNKVQDVPVGGSSEPLLTNKGIAILFVCNRTETNEADRDDISRTIGGDKLELQARRLIRDLRRAAYLDIRLGKDF